MRGVMKSVMLFPGIQYSFKALHADDLATPCHITFLCNDFSHVMLGIKLDRAAKVLSWNSCVDERWGEERRLDLEMLDENETISVVFSGCSAVMTLANSEACANISLPADFRAIDLLFLEGFSEASELIRTDEPTELKGVQTLASIEYALIDARLSHFEFQLSNLAKKFQQSNT